MGGRRWRGVARSVGAAVLLCAAVTTGLVVQGSGAEVSATRQYSGALRDCGAGDTMEIGQPVPGNISQLYAPDCLGADLGTVGIAPTLPTSLEFHPSTDGFERTDPVTWQWSLPICTKGAMVEAGTVCMMDWTLSSKAVDPAIDAWRYVPWKIDDCLQADSAGGIPTHTCVAPLQHLIQPGDPALGPGTQMFLKFTARVEIALEPFQWSGSACCSQPNPSTRQEYLYFNAKVGIDGTVHPNPVADFIATARAAGSLTWDFDASASTAQEPDTITDYAWDFDDGKVANGASPTVSHEYEHPGTYTVTLTVTDSSDAKGSVAKEIEVGPSALVVNSVGDAPNDAEAGARCDTGNTVGDDVSECTLRAAIQAANADGSAQTISFDVDVVGPPQITLANDLPFLNAPVAIDGTTQDGDWVELHSPNSSLQGLRLSGAGSAVRGMLFSGFGYAVVVDGAGARVEGNRFGTGPSGNTITMQPATGVLVGTASGVVITDNVISASHFGIQAIQQSAGEISGNRIGVTSAGDADLTPTANGGVVLRDVGPWSISGNVITAGRGVFLWGTSTAGTTITGNKVGVNAAGTAALSSRPVTGVFVNGVTGATITGNDIVTQAVDIGVTGSSQCEGSVPTSCTTLNLAENELDGPVTGGTDVVVENNRLGAIVGPTGAGGQFGITVYGKAPGVVVRGNRGAGHTISEVLLGGAVSAQVRGNSLGTNAAGTAALGGATGLSVLGATDSVVADNLISGHTGAGVRVSKYSPSSSASDVQSHGTVIEHNRVGTNGAGTAALPNQVGVRVAAGSVETRLDDNLISGNTGQGVDVVDTAAKTEVAANKVGTNGAGTATIPNEVGVRVSSSASETVVHDNLIGGNRDVGIRLSTTEHTVVTSNLVGRNAAGTALPNHFGVAVEGKANLFRNAVWSNTDAGIAVAPKAQVLLSENSTYANGGDGIDGPQQPPPPILDVVRVAFPNGEVRTWFVVHAVFPSLTEIFANPSCAEPSEGRDPIKTKLVGAAPGGSQVLVAEGTLTAGAGYTATSTTLNGETPQGALIGSTSEYSECKVSAKYPDRSRTGIPDIVQEALPIGNPDDPQTATFPSDAGEPIRLHTSAGRFSTVQPVMPPAGSDGVIFPTGLFSFQITELDPGASVDVTVDTSDVGAAEYWRYGPVIPGGAPRWYSWKQDPATGLGASPLVTRDGGLTTLWNLHFTDGLAGDDDSAANGTVVDPGGPGTGALTTPPPADAPPLDPAPLPTRFVAPRPATEIAYTGSSASGELAFIGVSVLALGVVLVRRARPRRALR